MRSCKCLQVSGVTRVILRKLGNLEKRKYEKWECNGKGTERERKGGEQVEIPTPSNHHSNRRIRPACNTKCSKVSYVVVIWDCQE